MRPKREGPARVTTGMRFPPELHARLVQAAAERDVSIGWLVNRACEHFLDRLLPVEEILLARERPQP